MVHDQVQEVNVYVAPQIQTEQRAVRMLVKDMAQEIERLGEDNKQLRAAVAIYREVLCRYTSQRAPSRESQKD
jgi:hypothetical protein